VRRAIERLPDDVRETYRLFAIEGHDYAQIATLQHIPAATVGTRLYRARKRLRALLIAELGSEPA
jgi:RNA polymerase sigma-70 factor (ECF subfamily)